MKIYFLRAPTEQQKMHEAKWSKTTDKILDVIKSKGEMDTKSLVKMTGYKVSTVNAQISILRRLGLVTSRQPENIERSLCPPHVWEEEAIPRPYGDTMTIRKYRVCGKTERV